MKQIAYAPLHRTAAIHEARFARSRIKSQGYSDFNQRYYWACWIVPEGFVGNISRELARLRLKEGLCPKYVAHQLEADVTQKRITSLVVGTTRLEFSIAAVRHFAIPLPPLPEQRAIAEALSDVDALIQSLDALITKKRHIKQGTMQQLLTGKKRLPGFSGEWEEKTLAQLLKSYHLGGKLSEQYLANELPTDENG